jgi:hypothetical protein
MYCLWAKYGVSNVKEDGTNIYHFALKGLLANELKWMKAEIFCGIIRSNRCF